MRLPRFQSSNTIVDKFGLPTLLFQNQWQRTMERVEADYVLRSQTVAWADPTGTLTRTTFTTYAGQVVSNPPTQAEVQAIDDHVKALSERLATLVTDLRAAGVLS